MLGREMRCFLVLLGTALLAGCAAEPKVIIKKIVIEKPVPGPIVYIDKCPPKEELQNHCAQFRHDKDKCDAEQRCRWYAGPIKTAHCRSLYCKAEGNPYPREK
jgi:hypothetical protein